MIQNHHFMNHNLTLINDDVDGDYDDEGYGDEDLNVLFTSMFQHSLTYFTRQDTF